MLTLYHRLLFGLCATFQSQGTLNPFLAPNFPLHLLCCLCRFPHGPDIVVANLQYIDVWKNYFRSNQFTSLPFLCILSNAVLQACCYSVSLQTLLVTIKGHLSERLTLHTGSEDNGCLIPPQARTKSYSFTQKMRSVKARAIADNLQNVTLEKKKSV